ncbi:hypothetical protein ACFLUZ_06735 [Chloroflexota bacterium]
MAKLVGKEAIGKISAVFPRNFDPDFRQQMDLPGRVVLNDLTLREGRQIEGAILRIDEYLRIARQLVDELNFSMIQTGCWTPADYEFVQALGKLRLKAKVEVMISEAMVGASRLLPHSKEAICEVVDKIADCGLGVKVNMACGDDVLLSQAWRRGEKDKPLDFLKKREIELTVAVVHHARSLGVSPMSILLQHPFNADIDYLKAFCAALENAGVDAICLDDYATGFALPQIYKERCQIAKKAAPKTPLGVHIHNNFGLATACSMASVEGGCEIIDGSVNGYGEASGITDLAQMAVIMEFLYGYDTGLNLEKLYDTCVLIAGIMGQTIPVTAPIVGKNAFSWAHDVKWQFPDYWYIFNPIRAEVVGNQAKPYFGEWSGPFGARMRARELGLELTVEAAADLVARIREQVKWTKAPLTDHEFRKLALAVGATVVRSD